LQNFGRKKRTEADKTRLQKTTITNLIVAVGLIISIFTNAESILSYIPGNFYLPVTVRLLYWVAYLGVGIMNLSLSIGFQPPQNKQAYSRTITEKTTSATQSSNTATS